MIYTNEKELIKRISESQKLSDEAKEKLYSDLRKWLFQNPKKSENVEFTWDVKNLEIELLFGSHESPISFETLSLIERPYYSKSEIILSGQGGLIFKIIIDLEDYFGRDFKKARTSRFKFLEKEFVEVIPANEELSDWISVDGCWTRIVKGGDVNKVADRRCFIEKTPRVYDKSFGLSVEDSHSWVEGFKGEYGDEDGESRDWCDRFAKYLGYRF